MEWLKNTHREKYEGLSRVGGLTRALNFSCVFAQTRNDACPPLPQTYVDYMSRLYEREIKDFFEVAKVKMAGTSKEAKGKFGKGDSGAALCCVTTSVCVSTLSLFICNKEKKNNFYFTSTRN